MRRVDKAVALVVRAVGARRELLVFRHPSAGVQIPKGTVDPGEDIATAALRELHEESGLALACSPGKFAHWDRRLKDADFHRWHLHLIDAPDGLPEHWIHSATGSEEENGLDFEYFWLPLDDACASLVHPLFAPSIELLRAHVFEPGNRVARSIPAD